MAAHVSHHRDVGVDAERQRRDLGEANPGG
jgi:hypothetical protein